jgi:creatinine amidohydrolase
MLKIPNSILLTIAAATVTWAQSSLPVKWEELTGPDFIKAIDKAQGVCVLPFGILEKHGTHLPIGTDLFSARYASVHAAEQNYAVVFPEYYFGQIFEARHQPGTVAYSAHLQLELLQETADEMARNGCKKIVIVNGHGGNDMLLPYFTQTQLASPRDYVVYSYNLNVNAPGRPAMKSAFDAHAGEGETSHVMITRPDLVHMDRVGTESGADLKRLDLPAGVETGIWWYASFPNHYAGDAAAANKELGQFDVNTWITRVANVIRAVKADQATPRLQNEFYEKAKHPLDTKQ